MRQTQATRDALRCSNGSSSLARVSRAEMQAGKAHPSAAAASKPTVRESEESESPAGFLPRERRGRNTTSPGPIAHQADIPMLRRKSGRLPPSPQRTTQAPVLENAILEESRK